MRRAIVVEGAARVPPEWVRDRVIPQAQGGPAEELRNPVGPIVVLVVQRGEKLEQELVTPGAPAAVTTTGFTVEPSSAPCSKSAPRQAVGHTDRNMTRYAVLRRTTSKPVAHPA